jgi:hypothetical protein
MMVCKKCGRKCLNASSLSLHARTHKRNWKAVLAKSMETRKARAAAKKEVA